MPKRTVPPFLALSLLIAATSIAQQPAQEENDAGIPFGYKAISLNLDQSDAIAGLVRKGDHVGVVSVDKAWKSSKTIAKQILVFSSPEKRENAPRSMFVVLLVRNSDANRITRALEHGAVTIVLSSAPTPAQVRSMENAEKSRTPEQHFQSSNSPWLQQIEKVRALACDIEKIAAELESLELYNRADELREQAQKLRVDVRGKN